MLNVLYEDNHLIAVMKPAGLLVQGDANESRCLLEDVRAYLKETYHKPGNVFVGLIHRLDRPVSGIVLFAKTSKGASRLSKQFREHAIRKTYHALIEGKMKQKEGVLTAKLEKDEDARKTSVSDEGKESKLSYRVVEEVGKNSLVEIDLGTGRFHQIRALFSSISHPVVGDQKYGASTKLPQGAIALAATRLEFQKATDDERIIVEIGVPGW
jgi:23S rRNA pseudouridine1911/1915/1917 synthase